MGSRLAHRLTRSHQLGQLVATGRKRAGLSQTEFASRLGVSRKTISDLERGLAQNLSFNTALQALWLAGLQLEATPRRPPTLEEVMSRRAADQARSDELTKGRLLSPVIKPTSHKRRKS